MVYLPDTMVALSDTMVYLPDTIVHLPVTMVDLPDSMAAELVNLYEYRADSNLDHPNPAYSACPLGFYGRASALVDWFLMQALTVKDSHMI